MNTRKILFTLLLSLVMIGVSQQAEAQLSLIFGDLNLEPDMAGQTIELFVAGGSDVDTVVVNLLIEDGGGITGGSNPDFNFVQEIDVITNTIFDGNNNGVNSARLAQDGFAFDGTTTASGFVRADGLIATLTLDTTGLAAGRSFNISTDSGADIQGATGLFSAVPLTTTQATGTINIVSAVPEPTSLGLLAFGASLILLKRDRKA